MPTVSHRVQISPDGQYICAAGTYKPRFRCYDVSNLSLKFERGLDSDVVKFSFLGDDYDKIIFLQCDRYLEFHSQFGRYYRTRIPKYGRDLAYHYPSCDLYIGGVSSDIYRLNIEQGRFLSPFVSKAAEVNCCEINSLHGLLACGTSSGTVECFDPRTRSQVGELDIALASQVDDLDISGIPAVTALKFRDGLNMGVGTSTGHILLYDVRSDKPLLVKDHNYELPIKAIQFQDSLDLVLSMDSKILKLWNRETGKAYTAIEPGTNLNDLCLLPDSGLLFMANEAPKVLTYYIPALGTAPKWCSFLDNLTEELEENSDTIVYDDYKFVTRKELDDLGLTHLIGSNLLRAYMHGFFMDNRLFRKAKTIAEPFAYEEYRKSKIREKIEQERPNRVKLQKLPKVNRDLAEKLIDIKEHADARDKKKVKSTSTILEDDRFSALFSKAEFQIDINSDEYKLMNPVVSKLDKIRQKKLRLKEQFEEVDNPEEDEPEKVLGEDSEDSSSDDEHTWTKDLKEQHKKLKREEKHRKAAERSNMRFYELKEGEQFSNLKEKTKKKETKKSFADRLEDASGDKSVIREAGAIGNKEMTFKFKRSDKEIRRKRESQEHREERRKLRRAASGLGSKPKPKFWMGKRVT